MGGQRPASARRRARVPAAFLCSALLSGILDVEDVGDTVLIAARTVAAEASSPECGLLSTRVHSRYRRTVWDLAMCGRSVRIELEVRRFFWPTRAGPGRVTPSPRASYI
ncbi:transposase family protein [Nonomuraea basaltis]|uniref:transposase family protein n=1 Tax=Nonomuraea basaltis TaxID=2495887 RepID=UPI003B84B148